MLKNQTNDQLEVKKKLAREGFMKNKPIQPLAKEVGIRKNTIYEWAEKGNWWEERVKLQNKFIQQQDIDILKEKEISLKLIKDTENKYAKELLDSEVMPRCVGQFAQLQRVKWEILTPKTISQYNFMKQENTSNRLTLQIIKPNDDMGTKQQTISGLGNTTGQDNN